MSKYVIKSNDDLKKLLITNLELFDEFLLGHRDRNKPNTPLVNSLYQFILQLSEYVFPKTEYDWSTLNDVKSLLSYKGYMCK